jgi:hypothetical protein
MQPSPDESFIPLTRRALSASERPDFRVTVVSPTDAQPSTAPQPPGAWSSLPQGSASDPRVTLQRDGDRVSSIRLQCACGRLIELACVYEDSPAQGSAPPAGTEPKPEHSAKA